VSDGAGTGPIDCHAHIFDPGRFPYAPDATYRPAGQEVGTLEAYVGVLDAHGIGRAVLVQPTSGYRFDHRCLLDALARHPDRLRAVVRVPPGRAREHLPVLDAPGVVGVRLDLVGDGLAAIEAADLDWLFAAMRERDLVVCVQSEGAQLATALPSLRRARLPVVVDHCGRPDPAAGLGQAGFVAMCALGDEGGYAKLSGAARFSRRPHPFADASPFVEAILERFTPARCIWGSDWPFVRLPSRLDYGPELALLAQWLPGAAARRRVLEGTPAALFGFGAAGA
jgi:predicted TIM-barrel fold metal-dependent hydrolase